MVTKKAKQENKKSIKMGVVCTNSGGDPEIVTTVIECSQEEIDEGEHYETAKKHAKDNGYRPLLAFDENDCLAKQIQDGTLSSFFMSKLPGPHADYVPKKKSRKKGDKEENYEVAVCRTGFGFNTISVKAFSSGEAKEKALDKAGDYSYSEKDADYTVDSVVKINKEKEQANDFAFRGPSF